MVMEFDINLINLVKQNESIYNLKKLDYRNNFVKKQIWAQIAEKLRSKPDICAKRWKSIRRRYIEEVRELEKGPNGVKKKKSWVLLKSLAFLNPHVSLSHTETSISSSCAQSQELNEHNYDYEPKFCAPNHKSVEEVYLTELHDEDSMDYKDVDIIEEDENPINNTQLRSEDGAMVDSMRHFLLSLEEPLRKLPYIAQMKTRQLLINVVIDQIEKNSTK